MEGSVQTEQTLLEELHLLRTRVTELEQVVLRQGQTEVELREMLIRQQEAQRELVEQSEQLKSIYESLADGMVIYDHEGHIKDMNAAYRDMITLSSMPEFSLLSPQQRASILNFRDEHGFSFPLDELPFMRLLRGETLTGTGTVESCIRTLDGRELAVSISGMPIRNNEQQIVGAVAVFRDVTARRKLEHSTHEALKALLAIAEILVQGADNSESSDLHPGSPVDQVLQRLARLVHRVLRSQRISITLVDYDTEVLHPIIFIGATSSNEAHQWKDFLEGKTLAACITDRKHLASLHSGKPLHIDLTQQPFAEHQSGSLLVPMHLNSHLVGLLSVNYGSQTHAFTSEELALVEGIARLTVLVIERGNLLQESAEARASELALLESNRRTDEFLSIASHELRTPLTTINGNIQLAKRRLNALLLSENLSDDLLGRLDLIQELLSRAERQVRVQNRLVGDLLDVSRIQANRLELHMRLCNLVTIVQETTNDQRSAAPARLLSLHLPDVENLPVLADSDRISQVLTNYITNALKYSASNRPVAIELTIDEQVARVCVRDEGPGLPAEELPRLWQRFYRVPGISVQSGTGVGLGLGLYICKTIIEKHDGQVGVESISGQGSTFWFALQIKMQDTSYK